jgi:Coenzyme PQQ synthesis protein D (PqqD)
MATMEDNRDLLAARPRVPEHVVERAFGGESVALNLQSGQYHGLNGVGARMLETLRHAPTIGDAVDSLAREFEQPHEVIERDLLAFVRGLVERGIVELDGNGRA